MSSTSIMQNPFLIVRFVFFALLANINLLGIVFASWNINATSTPASATVISLFNSCNTLLCVALGLAELLFPGAPTSQILFECSWAATLTVIQAGTAIGVSVHRPEISEWNVAASLSLLVQTTWLGSVISLAYFSVLFIATTAHSHENSEIWLMSVYAVVWFKQPKVHDLEKASISSESKFSDDLQRSPGEAGRTIDGGVGKAPWAQDIRRGIDPPFKQPGHIGSAHSSTTFVDPLPQVHSGTVAGSRLVHKFRDARTIPRSESPLGHANGNSSQREPFPCRLENHDLPIPLPRLSEWVPADGIRGIDVHAIPISP